MLAIDHNQILYLCVLAVKEISNTLGGIKLFYWSQTDVPPAVDKDLGHHSLCSLMSEVSGTPTAPSEKVSFHDRLLYIYTSGTTGLPKAAVITHAR